MEAVNQELLLYVVGNGIACDINVMMGEGSNVFTKLCLCSLLSFYQTLFIIYLKVLLSYQESCIK